ncbi:MAG: hypothetical protein NWF05_03065 [Candidatus Bathyarchaeota archaeon]|nr:hypothetical protein [Candidatus Bathyarchaeota archaeon]
MNKRFIQKVSILLLLSMFCSTQLTTLKTANADDASVTWGITDYDVRLEDDASEHTCTYIQDAFEATFQYENCSNFYGSATQRDSFYSTIADFEDYTFATVFYKGHTFSYSEDDHTHYFIYDNDYYNSSGGSDRIIDHEIHGYINNERHKFVFLWSCFVGNEIGDIDINGHSWGMATSWFNTNDLDEDGTDYYCEPSGHCFIGFRNVSMPFVHETEYQSCNYGNFCRTFYDYALDPGAYTIRLSLYYAAYDTFGKSYWASPLYLGYNYYAEGQYWYSRMEVYGDGNLELPDF